MCDVLFQLSQWGDVMSTRAPTPPQINGKEEGKSALDVQVNDNLMLVDLDTRCQK